MRYTGRIARRARRAPGSSPGSKRRPRRRPKPPIDTPSVRHGALGARGKRARGERPSHAAPSATTRVEAEARGAEGDDLQQPAGHREVLEEVDELVLVGEMIVEGERRRHR